MADYGEVTPGSGLKVSGDERTHGSDTVLVQHANELGSGSIATSQVTPTTTAATLVAARVKRKSVTFVNFTDKDVYIGPATVTTANGAKILASGGHRTLYTTALVQCIIASGTATGVVDVLEEYDS